MADTINQDKSFKTILIVRNDSTTAWEESTYCLRKGELGIGYLDNGNVIVKTGVDGTKTWAECPQVEGVFADNLTLTYAFGKYQPDDTGSFELKTKDKTMSEVMLDAFAQEVYTGLITGYPSASFSVTGGKTAEVGNTFEKDVTATITYNPAGSYKYGAKDEAGNKEQTDIAFNTLTITQKVIVDGKETSSEVANIDNANNGKVTYTLDVSDNILGDTPVTYTFYGTAKHDADVNRPLTNLGNWYKADSTAPDGYVATKVYSEAIGNIPAATKLNSKAGSVTYTGQRYMFMGTTKVAEADITVNSAFIRGLGKVKTAAAKTTKDITIAANDTLIFWAWPTSLTTAEPTFKYYFMGAWQPLAGPKLVGKDIMVEGANGYEAVPYTVYSYTTNDGYFKSSMDTRITIN